MKRKKRTTALLAALLVALGAGCGRTSTPAEDLKTTEASYVASDLQEESAADAEIAEIPEQTQTPKFFEEYDGIVPTLAFVDPTVTYTFKKTDGGRMYTFSKLYDSEADVLADMDAWAEIIKQTGLLTARKVVDQETNAEYRLYMIQKDGQSIGSMAGMSTGEDTEQYAIAFSFFDEPM